MKIRLIALAAVLAAAVGVTGALAGSAGTPGVTDTTILIGGTAPLSGEASSAQAVALGADAYFKWVNSQGGVNGRTITYKYLDDAYDPAKTIQAIRQLVQQDQVLAVFNTLGTNNNLAVRDFLNQSGVPQLFAASGADILSSDYSHYPWTIGYIPTYLLEGKVYGRYVVKTKPKARIAVLYQDDEYGHELLAGLKAGLGTKARQIVAAVKYDPTSADVGSEVAQLKASKADTFMIFAFGKFAIQAFLYANKNAWRPQIFVNAVAASANLMQLSTVTSSKQETTGTMSIVYFKDPTDPRFAKDAGLAQFRTILKAANPSANARDGYYVAGMAEAFTLVDALKQAGKNLTRDSLMKAALNLNEANNPFVLPGIVIKTSATDHYPMQQVGLERWNGTNWAGVGGLVTG
jgi:branched-chain amino acid transport system substrate-binding protein